MWDPPAPLREVDLLVEPPIAFDDLWARGVDVMPAGWRVRVASLQDLLTMKRLAGRPKDLEDIAAHTSLAARRR